MGSSKIGVYSTNVAAADGRVFARTTGGWTFALDADTGKTLWSSPHATGIHRAVIGRVLVSSSPDLEALDVKTGQLKWTIEDATANTAMPVAWQIGGKTYIIVGNSGGEIRCIESDNGKILWTITDSGKQLHRIASNAAGSNGPTYWMDGRLISQADASHSDTPLLFYLAEDPRRLRQLGDVWSTRHRERRLYRRPRHMVGRCLGRCPPWSAYRGRACQLR